MRFIYLNPVLLLLLALGLTACNSQKRLTKRALPVEETPVKEHWLGKNQQQVPAHDERLSWRERRQQRKENKRMAKLRAAEAEAAALAQNTSKPAAPQRSEATAAEPNALPASRQAQMVIHKAESFLGSPYKWGGNSKKGIDCSGLMAVSFAAAGVTLPRVSAQQAETGNALNLKQVQPGDMLFFATGSSKRVTHSGLVVNVKNGDFQFIHASNSGVRRDWLSNPYWNKHFVRARRILKK